MPQFAIVFNNAVREIRTYPSQPSCKYVDGLPTVRPYTEHDATATHKRGGYLIFDDRVERELVAKTPQDIAAELTAELDVLELQTARAMYWLIKKLLTKGVLVQADIPAPLLELKNRIDAINAELGS